ncbi:MAG: hypothetical protein K2X26_11010 [Chitinophagaceae bacterium]|jgi:hypothetical protein|nr:hypothetical protein [Chitinophagaceae bacterium]MCA6439302.1 hypothetical protein [Chitinophagaceae bacterium]MCA6446708.1 hypothetical protein [Chitinophagaceae bacterium]
MKTPLFLFLLVLFAGCNNKYESLVQSAKPSVLSFASDTLYIREKDPTNINASNKGMLVIYCSPADRQFNLMYSSVSSKVHFVYRGITLVDSRPFVVAGEENQLYCYADEAGIYEVEFFLTDQLGKTVSKKLVVNCKAGERPVAALEWYMRPIDDTNFQVYFNADGSSQPFGAVRTYHYLFEKDTVVVNKPLMRYFIHQKGMYPLSFFVVDDLGQSSDTINYQIIIQ